MGLKRKAATISGAIIPVVAALALAAAGVCAQTLSPSQCRMLTRHVPDADTTYRPDPNVVPADLEPVDPAGSPGSSMTMKVKPYAASPPTKGAAANRAAGPLEELVAGKITIDLDANGQARVSLNGRPLAADDRDRLAAQCDHPPGK